MRFVFVLLLLVNGCLAGCTVAVTPADKLFGSASQAPKLKVKKSWTGFTAEASTDFSGTLDGNYKPETGEISVKAAIASTATPVIGANAELIKSMETIRIADIEASVVKQQEVTKQMQHITDTARALGEAGIGVVGDMVKMVAGSSVDVTTPFGVGLSGTLGTPQPIIAAPTGAATMTTTAITEKSAPPSVAPVSADPASVIFFEWEKLTKKQQEDLHRTLNPNTEAPVINVKVVVPPEEVPVGVTTKTVTTEKKVEPGKP